MADEFVESDLRLKRQCSRLIRAAWCINEIHVSCYCNTYKYILIMHTRNLVINTRMFDDTSVERKQTFLWTRSVRDKHHLSEYCCAFPVHRAAYLTGQHISRGHASWGCTSHGVTYLVQPNWLSVTCWVRSDAQWDTDQYCIDALPLSL